MMWSAKQLLLGGLAVSGVAAAGFFAYRYYKNRNTRYVDDTKREDNEETKEDGEGETQDTQENRAKHTKGGEQVTEVKREENEDGENRGENGRKLQLNNQTKDDFVNNNEVTKACSNLNKEAVRKASTLRPCPRPKFLQHVKTMEELEMTFEALSAYLFTQNRSEEELKEAEKELGWAWNVAVAFKNRLPQHVPLMDGCITDDDGWLPLQDENGMQSVD